MKKILLLMYLFVIGCSVSISWSYAQEGSWGKYGDDPMVILDTVVDKANEDYKIQQSALDGVTDQQWSYQSQYKIANTLDYLKNNLNPYIQWAIYIWLSAAVILLIYNGFLMVTNSIHKQGDMSKVKKNISYIVIGVLLLTGFYFIIQLVVSLINSLFAQ